MRKDGEHATLTYNHSYIDGNKLDRERHIYQRKRKKNQQNTYGEKERNKSQKDKNSSKYGIRDR